MLDIGVKNQYRIIIINNILFAPYKSFYFIILVRPGTFSEEE